MSVVQSNHMEGLSSKVSAQGKNSEYSALHLKIPEIKKKVLSLEQLE